MSTNKLIIFKFFKCVLGTRLLEFMKGKDVIVLFLGCGSLVNRPGSLVALHKASTE